MTIGYLWWTSRAVHKTSAQDSYNRCNLMVHKDYITCLEWIGIRSHSEQLPFLIYRRKMFLSPLNERISQINNEKVDRYPNLITNWNLNKNGRKFCHFDLLKGNSCSSKQLAIRNEIKHLTTAQGTNYTSASSNTLNDFKLLLWSPQMKYNTQK